MALVFTQTKEIVSGSVSIVTSTALVFVELVNDMVSALNGMVSSLPQIVTEMVNFVKELTAEIAVAMGINLDNMSGKEAAQIIVNWFKEEESATKV